jgi:hypothetical protein
LCEPIWAFELAVTLGVVPHGRNGDVDAILAEQRNAGGGIDADEGGRDTETLGQGAAYVDVVAAADVAFARPEQRIVFADAGTHPALAEDADQAIDAGLRTRAGLRCIGTGNLDQFCESRIGTVRVGRKVHHGGAEKSHPSQKQSPHQATAPLPVPAASISTICISPNA